MFYTDLIGSHQREATLQERGQGWEDKRSLFRFCRDLRTVD